MDPRTTCSGTILAWSSISTEENPADGELEDAEEDPFQDLGADSELED